MSWSQALFLNEVMSNNIRLVDDQGENEDWIEIYNASSEIIDLSEYYLSDDSSEPDKWQFPNLTYILPNDFVLIWADDDESENQHLHCDFKLSKEGEDLFLYKEMNGSIVLVDEIAIPELAANTSYGRLIDGGTDFSIFGKYSPAFSNNINLPYNNETVSFSLMSGFYTSGTELILSTTNPTAQIYYTIDGKRPNENDILYTGLPIVLDSTIFIRATVVTPEFAASPAVDAFFLIDNTYEIPVVHIGTDSINLWNDYAGIYTTGRGGVHLYCSSERRNWNQPWKRKSILTFFEADGTIGFEKSAKIKISGNCSRAHKMKSIGVFLEDEETTEYPLFEHLPYTNYRQFKLRNSGNDSESTMLRDGAIQTLLQEKTEVDLMAYRPVVLYVNGVYFGIYGLREVMNEEYIEQHYGVEEIDVLSNHWSMYPETIEGNTNDWDDLSAWVTASDLSIPENYEYFKSQVEIDVFIDYFLIQTYIANTDWPANNMRMWRDREDPNSKWRWMIFDLDVSSNFAADWWCSLAHCNTLAHCLEENSIFFSNRPASTEWMRKLMNNSDFRAEFVQRHCTFAQSVFAVDRIKMQIDSLASIIRPEASNHIEHWLNAPEEMGETEWMPGGGSITNWEENVDRFKQFFEDRFEYTLGHLGNIFNIWSHFKLQINVENSEQGTVVLHENKMPVASDYLAKYFKNIPMRVEAVPSSGYRFVKWKETGSFEAIFYLSSNQNQSLTPIFVKEADYFPPLDENADLDMRLFPNPIMADELNYILAYGTAVDAIVIIYDNWGRKIWEEEIEIERHPKRRTLDLRNWQAGLYYFRLVIEGENYIEKIVVQ